MKAIWMLSILYLAGCSSTINTLIQEDHPAHPEAKSASYQAEVASLSGVDHQMMMAGSQQHDAHGDEELPKEIMAVVHELVEEYLMLSDQLSNDNMDQLKEHVSAINGYVAELSATAVPGDDHFWHRNMETTQGIIQAVDAMKAVEDLKSVRVHFAVLSRHLKGLLAETGFPEGFDDTAYAYTCSMYKDAGEIATWIQLGENVANPYFGSMMRSCSTGKEALSGGEKSESASEHEHHGH